MLSFKNTRTLLCLALALAAAAAQAAVPIEHWTLPSGARIYLAATDALPIVDVQIDFDAGSRRDPPAQAGLAGVTAGMVEKGIRANGSDPAMDQNALGEAWADLGADFDASAGADRMSFSLRTLSEPSLLQKAVQLAAREIGEPAFPEDVWERERERLNARSAKPTPSPRPWRRAPSRRTCSATIPTGTTRRRPPWRASTPRPCASATSS